MTIPGGTIKRIHVNQHIIRANARNGTTNPALTVKHGRDNLVCDEVRIAGPSMIVYRPSHPLSCGARVWLETTSEVEALTAASSGQGDNSEVHFS